MTSREFEKWAHHWITLSPRELNRVDRERVHGIEISIGTSPDDLPDAARGFYSQEHDCFVVEFRYLGESAEKRIAEPEASGEIELMVGKNSGRLYQIRLNNKAIKPPGILLKMLIPKVGGAIQSLEAARPNRIRNYEVARKVIEENGSRLFANVLED
jgi:hypothetical protein